MAVGTVHLQRRGDPAAGICWSGLFGWSPTLDAQPTSLVNGGPFLSKVGHRMGIAGHYVSDAELVLRMGGGSNGHAQYFTFLISRSNHKRIALVLMIDLVERADQTNASFHRYHFTAERDRHASHSRLAKEPSRREAYKSPCYRRVFAVGLRP